MPKASPDAATTSVGRKTVLQPPISLTKASKTLDVSMGTLRRAIDDGKLKAVKTEQGHYRIKVDELMQYKSNELDGVMSPRSVTSRHPIPSPRDSDSSVTRSAGGDGTVPLELLHTAEKDALRVEIKHQKDTIARLESDIQREREQVDKWQAQTESYKFMLTDERTAADKLKSEIEAAQEIEAVKLAEAGQGRRWLSGRNFAAMAVIGLVVAGYVYRDDLMTLKGRLMPVESVTEQTQTPNKG